jgi:methionyl-tRNA formyltransferase
MLRELGVSPKEVILMNQPINLLDEVRGEGKRYGYSTEFFDLETDVQQAVADWDCTVHTVETADVNSPEVGKALDRCESTCFIFTGGGILSREMLSRGKSFVHAHPGYLPDYKGSTCFYYSLLTDGSLGASLFVMEEKIDTGRIIARLRFDVNYKIQPDQPYFIDYILDPYIRAETLRNGIVQFARHGTFQFCSQDKARAESMAYYVMHPMLRHLTIDRLNRQFSATTPRGVFTLNQGVPT